MAHRVCVTVTSTLTSTPQSMGKLHETLGTQGYLPWRSAVPCTSGPLQWRAHSHGVHADRQRSLLSGQDTLAGVGRDLWRQGNTRPWVPHMGHSPRTQCAPSQAQAFRVTQHALAGFHAADTGIWMHGCQATLKLCTPTEAARHSPTKSTKPLPTVVEALLRSGHTAFPWSWLF